MNEADKSKINEVAHELALRTSEKGKKGKMKCLGKVSSFWIPNLKTWVLPGVGEGAGHANTSRGALPAEGTAGVKKGSDRCEEGLLGRMGHHPCPAIHLFLCPLTDAAEGPPCATPWPSDLCPGAGTL